MADDTYFWDRKGNPLSMEDADRLLQDEQYRTVGHTHVGPFCISTVWLGANFNLLGKWPLILFETTAHVTNGIEWRSVDGGGRYSTEDMAFAGHEYWVIQIMETIFENRKETNQ